MSGFDISTISSVYFGSTQYSAIYYGSTKLWPSGGITPPNPVHDYSLDYFTITSLDDNNEIQLMSENEYGYLTFSILASTDNGETWEEVFESYYGREIATLNEGESVIIKKGSEAWGAEDILPYFTSTGRYSVSGNIMSLIYGDNFIGQTLFLSGSTNVFWYMFYENSYLIDAQHLILPATTLVEGCYQCMFYNCELLTTAPELPATTLVDYCYTQMFYGCSALNYINCLATDISATNSTTSWVAGVASSGIFVKDSTMTSWTIGNNGIPTNWTITYVGSAGLQWSLSTYNYTLNNVFTAPTLINPNNLTVTYLSSNTSVATIDSSTGTVTLQGTGTTTISAAFAGDNNYNAQTVTYTLTVSKANAGLFWSTDTKTQLLSETFDAPTLSNPNSLTVTYSSSDTSVATINSSTGVVTINDAGNTTISATFAGNGVYNSQIVSYTLNVVASLTKDWGVDAVNEYTPDINRSYITDVSNLTADKMTVNYVKPDGTSGSFQSRFLRTSSSYGNPNQGISGFRTWINHYVSSYGNKISCWDDISSNTTILTTWANTTGVQVAYGWMGDLSTSGQNWGSKYTTKKIGAFKNCNLLGVIVMDGDLVEPEQYCNVSVKAWDGSQMTNDGRPCVSFDANTTINAKGALIAIVYTEN